MTPTIHHAEPFAAVPPEEQTNASRASVVRSRMQPPGHLHDTTLYVQSEQSVRRALLGQAAVLDAYRAPAHLAAQAWIMAARSTHRSRTSPLALLDEFGLASPEGGALMRLAEALLRTKDHATAWALICENLCEPLWRPAAGAPLNVRVVASLCRWAAALLRSHQRRLLWLSLPAMHLARLGVRSVADSFVVATDIPSALVRLQRDPMLRLCSIDCLGESARTAGQASAYLAAYTRAIAALADQPGASLHERHSVSVKLSALEARFGPRFRGTYENRLIPAVMSLARLAALAGVGMTIDAEEQDRLESTLDVFAALIEDARTREWDGLGIVVQAYGLRALPAIDWLAAKARNHGRRIMVRLVKGAYWDTEIKRAQERGLDDYPVFTDRAATDVSYLLAARRLFEYRDTIFPQFATHNALTIATVRAMAPKGAQYEFQRLHGMGEELYSIAAQDPTFPRVRAYAPVGSYEDLLAYLIRRLLENGANASFVRYLMDPRTPIASLIEDPVELLGRRMAATAPNAMHEQLKEHERS